MKFFIFLSAFMVLTGLACTVNAGEEVKRVAFVRSPLPPMDYTDVTNGFKKFMNEKGFHTGENIEYIDMLISKDDLSSLCEIEKFTQTYKDKVDIFITCGWVSVYVHNILKGSNTPQIFVPVLKKEALKMVSSLEEGSGQKISGIYLTIPPEKVLKLFKLTLPKASKYGVCWSSKIPADVTFKQSFKELENTMGIELVYFDLARGTERVINQIQSSGVDAFGGCVGIRKPKYSDLFYLDIPVISAKLDNGNILEMYGTNEISGFWNSFSSGGEQAAKMTMELWQNQVPIEEIVPQRIKIQKIYVNKVNADSLGIRLSSTLLRIAHKVYQ